MPRHATKGHLPLLALIKFNMAINQRPILAQKVPTQVAIVHVAQEILVQRPRGFFAAKVQGICRRFRVSFDPGAWVEN